MWLGVGVHVARGRDGCGWGVGVDVAGGRDGYG